MPQTFTLTIRCRTGAGLPLPGCRVLIVPADTQGRPSSFFLADAVICATEREVIANAEGDAITQAVPTPPDGRFSVRALHPATGAELIQPPAIISMPAADTTLSAVMGAV